MKKRIVKIISVFMLAVITVISVPVLSDFDGASAARKSEEIQAEINRLENTLKESEKEYERITADIAKNKNSLTAAQQNKAYIEAKLKTCEQNISDTEELIRNYEELISIKEGEISAKEKQIEDEYEQFRDWVRVSYEYGTFNYLEMFFSSKSLTDFLMNAELIGNMMSYESDKLDSLDEALKGLNSDYDDLKAFKATLDEKKASLDGEKAEYDKLTEEYQASIVKLQANQTSLSKNLKKIQDAEAELDKELTRLLAELAVAQSNEYIGGEFIWPVELKYKRISSYFGWRKLWGKDDYHRGIDIPADGGTNIYASNSGKVITATEHWSYGNYVIIDHGGGYSSLYAHASKLLVKVGDIVAQGDVIALVGTTGSSTGNHVHLEIRINGEIQDPLEFVTRPK